MSDHYANKISNELNIHTHQATAVIKLLEEGCTIPFIARYRKEATGSLDEVAITQIRDRMEQLQELDSRKAAITKSLEERDLMTEELRDAIEAAQTMAILEDIYLPFRPKRKTRASVAKEKGLEPLAQVIYEQGKDNPQSLAKDYIDEDKGVNSAEDALAGARDIIAEWINENSEIRSTIRQIFFDQGELASKVISGKEEEGAKFRDYFQFTQLAAAAPSHRVLAIFRGEKEGFLSVCIEPSETIALAAIEKRIIKARNECARQVYTAMEDGYRRLLAPSIETEIRQEIKKRADLEAIQVFAQNLRELLYSPPLGQKRVLALDPGFRTGAKLVCLDEQGKLLHYDTVYPTQSQKAAEQAGEVVKNLCKKFSIQAIAIGNGTASRETEAFVRKLGLDSSIFIVVVNESGASIYSASKVARDEFPDHDVTVRGAVSIGRRLMDPLAELVKIDPKSIGVGQYQHDVDQGSLKKSLDDVVGSCVNQVGVEVNTASKELLTYISGLGPVLAKNIIQFRDANGPFRNRKALMKVPRLGPKAFQQAAGFLRIRDAEHPLDSSAVHPESYHVVENMAKDLGCEIKELMQSDKLRKKLKLEKYISDNVGMPTLNDIMDELAKPGRDPRAQFEVFSFKDDVNSMDDLEVGMKLPGIVTNLTKFGVFVDIGVHQDGLVHISELADKFVKDPAEVVKVGQKVLVRVLEVDKPRKRISLSMKEPNTQPKSTTVRTPLKIKFGK